LVPSKSLPDPISGRPRDAVQRSMVSEQARQIILEQILAGDYEPGERLVETRISRELGVSQGSVREALRSLEGLGFVESAPYRGTRVRGRMTEAELSSVHPVRAVLEDLAAQTSVPALSADATPLIEALSGMRQAARDGDMRTYSTQNTAFHRAIVVAAANPALLIAWESLSVEARLLATTMTTVVDLPLAAELHGPILAAIERGDVAETSRLLREHQHVYQTLPHQQRRSGVAD